MTTFIAFCSVMLLTFGSAVFGATGSFIAAGIGIVGVLMNGFVFAHAQSGGWSVGIQAPNGLTLGRMSDYVNSNVLGEKHDLADFIQWPIYIANPDIVPATGLFVARIDGQQALVIEKSLEG